MEVPWSGCALRGHCTPRCDALVTFSLVTRAALDHLGNDGGCERDRMPWEPLTTTYRPARGR
ncbi:hypothetical protein COSMO_173 [Mycobacterium phage Cosmo]|uniref:Uncharacterized protein n=1 Tax=Mycobacterium phage Cosmo TaxID=1567467 RepID=A0A0B5A3G1_9CAUD|nr:hypothetical protein COSMO_173 [Mycobacterium phage Cosmo]